MTRKAKPATKETYLRGHHFMAAEPTTLCEGCHRSMLELVKEAFAANDDVSVCKVPHPHAESGQVLRIGPNWP